MPKICVTSVKTAKGTTTYIYPVPTNLCFKFQAKTPSSYGETSLTRFGLKKNSTENMYRYGWFAPILYRPIHDQGHHDLKKKLLTRGCHASISLVNMPIRLKN